MQISCHNIFKCCLTRTLSFLLLELLWGLSCCASLWSLSLLSLVFSLFWFTTAFFVAQRLKCLPGMQETWVWSLGWEDPLEKEMATHSSALAWRIPWREEPGRLQSMGLQRVGHDWVTLLYLLPFYIWIVIAESSTSLSTKIFLPECCSVLCRDS